MEISDKDFIRLCEYIKKNFGVNLEKKRTLVEGRLAGDIKKSRFNNFSDFIEDVYSDTGGKKINALMTRLTTNYTYFMREEAHYLFMQDVALPHLKSTVQNRDLRIWSAGCASGEEPYTTAMVLSEWFGLEKSAWDTTILATDISIRVLDMAKAGVYPEGHFAKLNPNWKSKYFVKIGPDEYKVSDRLAKEVVFAQFNLMGDFSRFKKKFHIIFCRNVMIYFDSPTKIELVKKFYNALEVGGWLFVGLSETLTGINSDFEQIAPSIYRRVR